MNYGRKGSYIRKRNRRNRIRRFSKFLAVSAVFLSAARVLAGFGGNSSASSDVIVPKGLENHIYLDSRSGGSCNSLTGKVLLTIIFVNDADSSWTKEDIQEIQTEQTKAASSLKESALSYGAELELEMNYMEVDVKESFTRLDHYEWVKNALCQAGFKNTEEASEEIKRKYDVKEAPILFYANRPGRSFAIQYDNSDRLEYSILYRDAGDFRHELNHLFGADDYYYPEKVKTIAQKYFQESVMLSSDSQKVDSLTAYLIGWTDEIEEDALEFLYETVDITRDEMTEEFEKEVFTGKGSKRIGEGTYTGDLVDGLAHGKGKMVWDNGVIYEGEWESNLPHGEGKMIWTNGTTYVGEFVKNKMQGYGTMTFANGYVQSGLWENNEYTE